MAIDALARGGAVLDAPRFLEAAREAASFILETLRSDEGGLLRIYAGGRASISAFLEDYAALADGLLSLYEATGEERWFVGGAGDDGGDAGALLGRGGGGLLHDGGGQRGADQSQEADV